jgi:peptide/nickel transport system permease protein
MLKYIARRLLEAIPTIFLVLTLVFFVMRILPGDPAIAALGDVAGPEQIERFRERMGLNAPLWQQYLSFITNTLQGDFGRSMSNNLPIGQLLLRNLPYTMQLTAAATLMAILIGVPIGILSAVRRNKPVDYVARLFALLGFSVPDFYLGSLLLISLSLGLGLFPIMGGGGPSLASTLHHLFLPALTLGLIQAAFITRLTRSAVLEVLRRDYVRTARSKGLAERIVLYKHVMRNALIPVVTGLGIYILTTLSGSITIELVFSRPGIGQLMIGGISSRDYAMVQATLVIFSLFVVLVNLIVDLLYAVIDPRIRTAS